MRRSLVVLALIAVPLAACGSGPTTPAAQTTSAAAVTSSADAAMSSVLNSMTAMGEPPESITDQPDSPVPSDDSMHPAPDATTVETAATGASTGVTITTAGSDFGEVLFDGTGQAIYLFDKETTAVPDCYGDCAVAWPPVLTEGSPVAGGGAMTDLLGSIPRTDGSTQVIYAGHPLYYYAHEGKNEVTCHNVNEFGGLWLVITPTGRAAA